FFPAATTSIKRAKSLFCWANRSRFLHRSPKTITRIVRVSTSLRAMRSSVGPTTGRHASLYRTDTRTPTFSRSAPRRPCSSRPFNFKVSQGRPRSAESFRPTYHNRNTLAFRFLGTFATSFGGDELPPFERSFAGGENTLRTFD